MEITKIKCSQLLVNEGQIEGLPTNPRSWTKADIEKLARSLEETPELFEARPCIVYPYGDKYIVLGGNMRLTAAKTLKYKDVPCIVIPAETTIDKLKEIVIKDNGAFGAWDFDELANKWDDLPLTDWGVPAWEEKHLEDTEQEAAEDDFDETADQVETRCQKGDIWKLGEHRLMCGDSTSETDVAELMDGNQADIAFTSPPYNMKADTFSRNAKNAMRPNNGETYNTYKDNVTDSEYTELLCKSLQNGLNYAETAMWNIGILAGSKIGIIEMLERFKDKFCDIIVWKKKNCMPVAFPSQKLLLAHICEFIFCFNREGNRAFSKGQWAAGTMTNCIETENASNTNEFADSHAATFPVSFAGEIVKNFSKESVIDLFGGTGTTMIAAEQLGRKAYLMELDTHYCDIILARWEKLTGKQAVKL